MSIGSFKLPRNNVKEQATHISRLVLSYFKQRRPRMCCHRAQNMLILKSLHLSFTSKPFVCASMVCTDNTQAYLLILKSLNLSFTSEPVIWVGMICTDNMQASHRQCYVSQNIGPAVSGSSDLLHCLCRESCLNIVRNSTTSNCQAITQ